MVYETRFYMIATKILKALSLDGHVSIYHLVDAKRSKILHMNKELQLQALVTHD